MIDSKTGTHAVTSPERSFPVQALEGEELMALYWLGSKHMADMAPAGKYMLDPYLDWARLEGIPIHEEFGLDLSAVATAPWPRFGVNGAIIHVKGRGDAMTVLLVDIPPRGQTVPQKHIFEAAFYVLSGTGSAIVERYSGEPHQFEWGPGSVF